MSEHFVIPDTQVSPSHNKTDHLTAAGNYIVERQPTHVINLGDHWDMKSLSAYDRKTAKAEGARYCDDIEVGVVAMDALMAPINALNARRTRRKIKKYKPEYHFLMGNHEERILRHTNVYPELIGTLGYHSLGLEEAGWQTHDFLEMVEIDGVTYSHFFANPNTGRPWGGVAKTRLSNIGFTFTMGHQQGKDLAEKPLANGKTLRGLIVGSYYQHDEDYRGPQGNTHWRGCIYKHDVHDGNYAMMELPLEYMLRNWT